MTTNLLVVAKSVSINPDAPGSRNQLTTAARFVKSTFTIKTILRRVSKWNFYKYNNVYLFLSLFYWFYQYRSVSESLNQLIDACSSAAPGQKECDNAVRRIQALKPLLDNPNEPVNNSSYFDCQQIVVEKSKLLGKHRSQEFKLVKI